MSSDKNNPFESNENIEEYSQSEEEDFMVGMSAEQRKVAEERLYSYQEQFRVFNNNQKISKVRDVQQHLPNISEEAAQLAIDSCHNNELIAVKRLLEDKEYYSLVTSMASGEIPLNMDAIMYVDRRQELRDALRDDPEEPNDSDESDNWVLQKRHSSSHVHILPLAEVKRNGSTNKDDEEFSDNEYTLPRRRSRSDRRVPRLCLDDALIMLASLKADTNSGRENEEGEGKYGFGDDSDHHSTHSRGKGKRSKKSKKNTVSGEPELASELVSVVSSSGSIESQEGMGTFPMLMTVSPTLSVHTVSTENDSNGDGMKNGVCEMNNQQQKQQQPVLISSSSSSPSPSSPSSPMAGVDLQSVKEDQSVEKVSLLSKSSDSVNEHSNEKDKAMNGSILSAPLPSTLPTATAEIVTPVTSAVEVIPPIPPSKQTKRNKPTSSSLSSSNGNDDYEEESSFDSDNSDTSLSRSNKKTRSTRKALAREADLFRALSGSASRKIPVETLRQLGWSEARIKAFRNRERNPNQYYYRFNNPGEPQATGKWSAKDKALFLQLIKERGVDYQWGIFSMNIPGRVGYQCSNFYRQLIKEGEIKDSNYTFDKSGKLVFKFKDKRGNSTLVRRGGRRRQHSSDEYEDFQEEYEKEAAQAEMPEEEEEILPDYIDPMTMMPVVKPAISPYGHVMGYDSWVKVLNRNPKNTCPFTKMKLTRRSLVKLTADNIDEYRDKIIKVSGFDIELRTD